MDLDFSISTLFAGFTFGVFGWWMFRQGKQRGNYAVVGIGVTLMAYPYFVSNAWLAWGIGLALCGLAYRIW